MHQLQHHKGGLAWVILPAGLMLSGMAAAATNTELEQRIETLERQLRQQQAQPQPAEPKQATTHSKATSSNRKFDGLLENTEIDIGGYVKLDVINSAYSGSPAPSERGRAFYIPALVPVSGDTNFANPNDSATDFQARETRLNFSSITDFGSNKFKTFIEIDFLDSGFDGASASNERLVNDSGPRLRHAFVEWNDSLLLGQTWSTFMDLGAYPENLDFVGPAEGIIFIRQSQVRFSHGPFQFALENPETTVTPNGGPGREQADNETLPDVVTRYTFKHANGSHISAAALLRQLDGDGITGVTGRDKTFGYGLTLSGKFAFGLDDIRYQFNYGDGIGRYLGLNTSNSAVIDNTGNLERIEAFGGYVSLRHFWTPQWRSNLTYGYFSADNETALTGTGATKKAQSAHLNLLYSPVKAFTIGGEYIYATREEETGLDGYLSRFQFSGKYAF